MVEHNKVVASSRVVTAVLVGALLVIGGSAKAPAAGEPTTAKQDSSTGALIPTTEPEIRRLRVQWFFNRAFDAYSDALAKDRPTFIFFTARPCGFCFTMFRRFRCPAIVRYAGVMNFNASWRKEDEGGDHLAAALNVQRYPTVVILKTHMDKLHVIGRIEGIFSAPKIDQVIQEALREYFSDKKRHGPNPVGIHMQKAPHLPSVEEARKLLDKAGIARPSEAFCAGKSR